MEKEFDQKKRMKKEEGALKSPLFFSFFLVNISLLYEPLLAACVSSYANPKLLLLLV